MNKIRYLFIPLLLLMAASNVTSQEIITTTGVLSSAVKEIVRDKLTVENLVPSTYCPGHFDIKSRHLAEIEKSGFLLAQGFEPYLEQIKNSVKSRKFSPVIVKIEGSWFILENQKRIYSEITKVLSERFPQYRSFFEDNLKNTLIEIEHTDRKIKEMIKKHGLSGRPVICNSHIKEMLQYIGFNVVGTYGRTEELTPFDIKQLIETGKKEGASLVIDNIQAGPDTGKVIADELKIPHIAISNFPGAFPAKPTIRETLYRNTELIIGTYEKHKDKVR